MQDEITLALATYSPAAVMEIHVMETTQEDAAIDVCSTALPEMVDVVRLAV